ncbi:MAG: DNA polymerase I [Candidatus Gygaella obscura]|nr:DNA polymerase I [Candidatus Gygaella obscura]
MKNPKELILIDANSFCYRAFYAIKQLQTSYGQSTNAVYGFVVMINKIVEMFKPEYLGVCFDVSRKTFRSEKFRDYKLNRPAMPDELVSQIDFIKELVRSYNFALLQRQGYEADDIIATACRTFKNNGFKSIVISSDKDMLQLVDDKTFIYNPQKDKGLMFDKRVVLERVGLHPEQIVDFISLTGDNADNIPGVKGIGEKTAVLLLKEFKTVDGVLKNLEEIKKPKLRDSLRQAKKQLTLNRELITLDSNVDVDVSLDNLKVKEPDYKRLSQLYRKLEFKSLLKQLPDSCDREVLELKNDQESFIGDSEGKKAISFFIEEDCFYLSFGTGCVWKFDSLFLQLKEILEDNSILKITHDLKKAYSALSRCSVELKGELFDILLAGYLLDSGKSEYSVKDVLFDFLEKQVNHNFEAVNYFISLKEILLKKLKDNQLDKLFFEVELPFSKVLSSMEREGFSIDVRFLKDLSEKFEIKLKNITEKIFKISEEEFNINSPKQLRVILFDKFKLPVVKKTKTGPSTDEEVLKVLSSKHELPVLLLEYRQINKLKSTYVDVLPELVDKKNKIHCNFKQFGTGTGRLSCENPNLQNIPVRTAAGKEIRRAFICSRKDNVLISSDYSQIELRILAHLSKDKNLVKAFKKGEDIHRFTAGLVFDVEEKDVDNQMRNVAKRVNFGIIYGMSAFGLAKDLSITNQEAQNFIDTYFLRYPKVKEYIQGQIKFAENNGYVETVLGRKRFLPFIKSKVNAQKQFAYRQAINTPVQGSAAELMKLAMINIHELFMKNRLSAKIILQVHDELIFEVNKNSLEESISVIRSNMEQIYKIDVPIKTNFKQGSNWFDMVAVN